jgi:hypothetical protein
MRVDTGRLRVVSPEASAPDMLSTEAGREGVGATMHGPPSPGRYIREQRERQNMSIEQLAAATKIPRDKLMLLEDDRYEELAGSVFVKGFLRCCARSLSLDEQSVIGLLYEQEREKLKQRRRDGSGAHTGPISGPVSPITAAESSGLWPRMVARVSDPRLILWLVVALLVALVVIVAFTLASAQGGGPPQS